MLLLVLSLVLVVVYVIINIRSVSNIGGVKSFECGMNRLLNKGSIFSLRFFVVSLLFLLMDLELVMLVYSPVLVPMKVECVMVFSLILWVFVLGTIWEWWVGSIDWSL